MRFVLVLLGIPVFALGVALYGVGAEFEQEWMQMAAVVPTLLGGGLISLAGYLSELIGGE